MTIDNEQKSLKPTSSAAQPRQPQDIFVTIIDKERLEGIIQTVDRSVTVDLLEEELERATVVSSKQIPPDVVTMNSLVRFKDLDTGEESEAILSYPGTVEIKVKRISVLAPVGAALLGLRIGDEIEWPVPSGKRRLLKIIAIPSQPEADLKYDL